VSRHESNQRSNFDGPQRRHGVGDASLLLLIVVTLWPVGMFWTVSGIDERSPDNLSARKQRR